MRALAQSDSKLWYRAGLLAHCVVCAGWGIAVCRIMARLLNDESGGGISTVMALLLPILVVSGGVFDDAGNEVTQKSITVGMWLVFFTGLFLLGIPTAIRYLVGCYFRARASAGRGDLPARQSWVSFVESDSLIGHWVAGSIGTLILVLVIMAMIRAVGYSI